MEALAEPCTQASNQAKIDIFFGKYTLFFFLLVDFRCIWTGCECSFVCQVFRVVFNVAIPFIFKGILKFEMNKTQYSAQKWNCTSKYDNIKMFFTFIICITI